MKTLHVAPGESAGATLQQAIRGAGLGDDALAFPDDLSCGPIDDDDPAARGAWWDHVHDGATIATKLRRFWERLDQAEGRLVVWFGRGSARELAFLLRLADRLGERPYAIIEVAGRRTAFVHPDGAARRGSTAAAVSMISADGLSALLGSERTVEPQERADWRQSWQRLREENAPFRVVTPEGLVSAPIDHFDRLLLEHATQEWRKVAYLVGDALCHDIERYFQVGDLMLQSRVVALVEMGRLEANGDPWEMHACQVRLRPPGDAPPQ